MLTTACVVMFQLANFAADIGGTVGLWLGLSVFSAFEIINLFVQLIRVYMRKIPKKARKHDQQQEGNTRNGTHMFNPTYHVDSYGLKWPHFEIT